MTEIVAAHLERVARETAEKWLGPEPYVPAMASGASWVSIPFEATFTIKPHTQLVGELTALVAAALAACAREAGEAESVKHLSAEEVAKAVNVARDIARLEEAKWWHENGSSWRLKEQFERLAALERAVGESVSDSQ